ncbi:MAG: carbohydrate porin [Candidatus Omnitrophota bacterium]
MKKLFTVFLSMCFFCLMLPVSAKASQDEPTMKELMAEIKSLKNRVVELESKLNEQGKSLTKIKKGSYIDDLSDKHQQPHGGVDTLIDEKEEKRSVSEALSIEPAMPGDFKIGADITAIIQSSPDTHLLGGRDVGKTAGSYQANVTIANEFRQVNGMALANLRIDQGNGVEPYLTVYSNVDNNVWEDDEFSLSEMFYEQRLLDNKIVIDFGKLDPTVFFDLNKYAGSDTTQFLARIFNNSPVIEFPDNAGGITASIYPEKWLQLGYLVISGDPALSRLGSELFHLAHIGFRPKVYGREGTYRFETWLNTNPHTRWDDVKKDNEYAYGFSLSFDQEVTDEIGVFTKFGWQEPKVYNPASTANVSEDAILNTSPDINNFSLEYMWSAGLQIKGGLWGRKKDVYGIALGQVMPSGDMKDALASSSGNDRKAKDETHFETYYNIYANKYLGISPGVQLIWDPYGADSGSKEMISVYTLRAHVDF